MRRPRPCIFVIASFALLGLFTGCGEKTTDVVASSSRPAVPGDVPDVVSLQSAPTAVNWDGNRGADGLVIRMYFFHRDRPKAAAIRTGTVEFSLFEGAVDPREDAEAKRVQRWVYTADQLASAAGISAFGEGYSLQLPWAGAAPTGRSITLLATYYRGIDPVLRSRPVVIAMP